MEGDKLQAGYLLLESNRPEFSITAKEIEELEKRWADREMAEERVGKLYIGNSVRELRRARWNALPVGDRISRCAYDKIRTLGVGYDDKTGRSFCTIIDSTNGGPKCPYQSQEPIAGLGRYECLKSKDKKHRTGI